MSKQYLGADSLTLDSFQLGRQVLDSGFQPTWVIGILRGGAPIAITVHEFLEYHYPKTKYYSITTSRYDNDEVDKPKDIVEVHGLEGLVSHVGSSDRLLIVDDVFDTGLSLDAVYAELQRQMEDRYDDNQVRTATIYYKPKRSEVNWVPDYYVHEVDTADTWLNFPHELGGLTLDEVRQKDPRVYDLLRLDLMERNGNGR